MKNKVSLKNPKDQNFETYQSHVSNLLDEAAHKLFKDKTFDEEFKGVFAFSSFLKYLSNLASFITGFVAVQIAANWLLGAYLSAFVAFGFCLLLEGIKVFLWSINSKWILKYKRLSRPVLGTLVCLHLLSLGFSAYGGYMLPLSMAQAPTPSADLLDLKQVSSSYNQRILKIDSLLALNAAKVATTTSNSTIKSLNKVSSSLLSQKDYQEKAKNQAIERAIAQNKGKQQEIREKAKKRQIMDNERLFVARLSCLVASILFELLFVVCSVFCAYYQFRLYLELEISKLQTGDKEQEKEPSRQQDNSHDKQAVTPSTQQAGAAPKIGFKSSAQKCQLGSCSKSFVSAVHNKKYCSDECRKMAYQERRYSKNQEN